ncbi:MAG: hypothetical protein WD294_04050 [Phycisphaeraceae bacterium]
MPPIPSRWGLWLVILAYHIFASLLIVSTAIVIGATALGAGPHFNVPASMEPLESFLLIGYPIVLCLWGVVLLYVVRRHSQLEVSSHFRKEVVALTSICLLALPIYGIWYWRKIQYGANKSSE